MAMEPVPYNIGFVEYLTDFHSRHLYINRNGFGFFINGYSDTLDFQGEIGWYRGRIGDNFIQPLKNSIERGSFLSGPEYQFERLSGYTREKYFFEKGKSTRTYSFDVEQTLPVQFKELKEQYDILMKQLKSSPWKTLCVAIEKIPDLVYIGDYANVFITFKNIGTEKIDFGNPSSPSGGVIDFSLHFAKENPSKTEPIADYLFTIDLKQTELLLREREVVKRELRMLTLDPSAQMEIKCRCRIPKCPEGDYSVELLFDCKADEQDLENQNFIEGEVHTKTKELIIKRRRM